MSRHDSCVHTAVLHGVEAVPVDVEVDLSGGIPGISIVGMPDVSVLESRSRVRCALRACGFEIPRMAVTVNLAPADLRKSGTGFDLPIAVGILAATGQIPTAGLSDLLFVGELGLTGEVFPARGSMAYLLLAREQGLAVAGAPDLSEAAALGCDAVRVPGLASMARGVAALADATGPVRPTKARPEEVPVVDFADVVDQEVPKRALVIAAAGSHGVLMVGPPGAGKTMLAKRLPGILPPLSPEERVESALIHSVAGLETASLIGGARPFASPHHSVTTAGLIGGGRPVRPGQVSLAHNGVLFLDELPEFAKTALQSLRQPMEEGVVRLVRADGSYRFPARFQLVGAANPCPCGHLGDPGHECLCSPAAIERYQGRIGGPVMDRIDLVVDVARPRVERVIRGDEGLSSAEARATVLAAREFASWRTSRSTRARGAGAIDGLDFEPEAADQLSRTASALHLGGRAVARIARVARTVADIEKSNRVRPEHVAEAAMFRSRDKMGGER